MDLALLSSGEWIACSFYICCQLLILKLSVSIIHACTANSTHLHATLAANASANSGVSGSIRSADVRFIHYLFGPINAQRLDQPVLGQTVTSIQMDTASV
jgi:hypothetical protein